MNIHRILIAGTIILVFGVICPDHVLRGQTPKKPMLMWFDATANFRRLSDPDSIRYYIEKVHSLGFTDIVLDIKPITGEVLYRSAFAPQMKEWNGFTRPDSFDFILTVLSEARKRSLRVHASMNVFSAGHNFIDRGIVYTTHPEWQSMVYTDTGTMPMTKVKKKYSAMTNPADPEVQEHELSVIAEAVRRYDFDGIILDRVRYDGICADFSPLSRQLFESFLGKKLRRFPEDIFEWKRTSRDHSERVPGIHYKEWLEWRATVISHFILEVRQRVKSIKPSISLGDYTGSWYPLYYEMGVNWASKQFDPAKKYDWATPTYWRTGYAELLDLYTSGNYYFEVTKAEVEAANKEISTEAGTKGERKEYWYSVEGSCEIAKEVIMNAVPIYGGLYVEQYTGHPEQFSKAIAMCLQKSDGLMIFDLVHIINLNWWEPLEKGIHLGRQKN
jgi:uncharacterized lipoprotein YddW (UPF0748 family)